MSKKYQLTCSDYLEWNQCMNLIRNLYDDEKYRLSLFVACSCFWGLRVSDTLVLTWLQVLNQSEFIITEKKTKKSRQIKINNQLTRHISDCYYKIHPQSTDEFIFLSRKHTIYTVQALNKILKTMKFEYNLKVKNFSTHSFRKAFGREVFNRSAENAELSLVRLSQLFNHSNPSITRRYLGISQQELLNTYDVLSF